MNYAELSRAFQDEYGVAPKIFSAPGRVNLIGEHTDYNEGFVLPCAIGFRSFVAIAPRSDGKLLLRSDSFRESFEFEIDRLPLTRRGAWSDYVLGVARGLQQRDFLRQGASVLVHGEVPIGAGLSSSAAIEVASALAIMSLSDAQLPMAEVAKLCQQAENAFVGARVGIMDQFVACFGEANHALRLDCRSLQYQLIPIPQDVRLVICNTMVKHELAGGEYNRRREECDEGVRILANRNPDIHSLRDVSTEQLEKHKNDLPPTILKRCRHVVSENERVLQACDALIGENLARFGELMGQSHASLRNLYEVSCAELDTMVEVAEGLPGFWGGRMTGGGFGGCTINLVKPEHAQGFVDQVASRYEARTGIHPDIYVCTAADGASAESDSN